MKFKFKKELLKPLLPDEKRYAMLSDEVILDGEPVEEKIICSHSKKRSGCPKCPITVNNI